MNGRYRVATEKTLLAMPETAIGLFPDCGVGHFLSRLPNNLGTFLGLTGNRLKGWDNYHVGIATHFVTSEETPNLLAELNDMQTPCPDTVEKLLDEYHRKCFSASMQFSLQSHVATIESIFSGQSVEVILERLESEGSEWSLKQFGLLKRMSPTSLKLTLRHLQASCTMNLKDILEMDYRMVQWVFRNKDLHEGIRAMLLDHDNAPVWTPGSLVEVTDEMVDSYFQPLGPGKELVLLDHRL